MKLKYGLEDRPPFGQLILYGLQWFAIAVPIIVIIGKIASGFHFTSHEEELAYMQKLSFVMAIALFAQVMAGHQLPLIIGPSTVLLIGIVTSHPAGPDQVYTAIMLGGVMLAFFGLSGASAHLQRFFTARVVAVVLLLVAFTMTPTILTLIAGAHEGQTPLANICFALVLIVAMFLFFRHLQGIWRSTVIIWAIIVGSIIYLLVFQNGPDSLGHVNAHQQPFFSGFFQQITLPTINVGVLLSFFFCFLALSVNDLGSIQSVNEILKPQGQSGRITWGITVTGLANILAGFLGVIGPVNFSLSPGVIASTGCASRITLLPAAFLLLLLAFMPDLIAFFSKVPSVVIGSVLVYILCSQIAAGLSIIFESKGGFQFETGLIIGLPILLGTIIAFLPESILATFPGVLRPVAGNGFVVGVIAGLVLEHLVFRSDNETLKPGGGQVGEIA